MNRRDFLTTATSAAAMSAVASTAALRGAAASHVPAPSRILILGGTGFIGPHMVRRALERGHEVTLFNRGRSAADLFPHVETLIGDRNDDLTALEGRQWDVVIDNSATNPKWVRDSTRLLRDSVDIYFFTSTRSVFRDFSQVGMDVDGPLWEVDRGAVDRGERLGYGPDKVLCEMEVREVFEDRTLIVRPGIIVGPGDHTDRFTYWPARIHQGGEVLAPGDPDNPVMFIDIRDMAEWYIHLVERRTTGTFMALGPEAPLTFAEMLYGIKAVTNTPVTFTWADTDFLLEQGVRPYADMPLWRPARDEYAGFQRFDLRRSIDAGLRYRPFAVTARDTLDFHLARPFAQQVELRAGVTSVRESELLTAWHAHRAGGP